MLAELAIYGWCLSKQMLVCILSVSVEPLVNLNLSCVQCCLLVRSFGPAGTCPLGLELCLADKVKEFASPGKAFTESVLSCRLLEEFIQFGLVKQFLVVLYGAVPLFFPWILKLVDCLSAVVR